MDRRGVERGSRNGLKLRLVVACVAVLGSMALNAGLAQGHIEHARIGELSAASVGGGPTGVAIDQSNQDIYVGSNGSAAVFKFGALGEPIEPIPLVTGVHEHLDLAVDSSSHDIYVPEGASHFVEKLGPGGEFICDYNMTPACPGAAGPAFTGGESPEAVAVDPSSGTVYISDKGGNAIDVYSPSGVLPEGYIAQITGAGSEHPISTPRDVKVDSLGDVYVANEGGASVLEFTPSTEPATGATTWTEARYIPTENATSIAIDAANDVYIALVSGLTTEYSPAGVALSQFNGEGTAYGMAVNNTTGNIYFSNISSGAVVIYNTFNAATVTTEAATEREHESAKLNGTVNPEGLPVTNCFFEYGAAQTAPCEPSAATISGQNIPVAVSAKITGLSPGTKYPYHLVVEVEGHNDNGTSTEFEAVPLATLTTEPATNIEPESATLNGSLTPLAEGEFTYYIEYGEEGGALTKTPVHTTTIGAGEVGVPIKVEEPVAGLTPSIGSTNYNYRVVAEFEGHTFTSEPLQSFATPPVATATTEPATNEAAESATLNGKVNVLAGTAKYYFEYFQEGAVVASTTAELPLTKGEHSVTANVAGLAPNKPYFFHLVVVPSNPPTPINGSYESFRTKVGLPVISKEAASHQERHSARVTGEVDPKSGETTYYFEYATAQEYEETGGQYNGVTPVETITAAEAEATTGPRPVQAANLSELHPGTVYHYRLVAVNTGGTTHGTDATFATTAPKKATIANESGQPTSQTSATVSGEVNAQGLQSTYVFEMGADTSYGTPSFGEIRSDAEGAEVLTFQLTNLLPGTTYHYRFVVVNEDGTVEGADHEFTTPGFPAVISPPATLPLIAIPQEPKEHVETRGEKYSHAVANCRKKPRKKRAACLRTAKKRFGPIKKK